VLTQCRSTCSAESINIVSTRPTKHIKDKDKTEDEALAHIKEIVIGIYTIKDIYIKEDTKKAKKIKNSDKRSAISVTNKVIS
jgi:hypothetical protein